MLEEVSRRLGFAAVGIAAIPESEINSSRFAKWIGQGYAGEMEYLKRRNEQGLLIRSNVRTAFPWARSVVVCAANYNREGPRSIDQAPKGSGWIARYAWSGRRDQEGEIVPTDYHDDLLARLKQLESSLLACAPCITRCYIDTGPIVERSLAAEAGIGWIGKNTCVLNQQLGSWMFLGVILTSLELDPAVPKLVAQDRCGSCTRCIDACPTDALLGSSEPGSPRTMDASRCISYLTIEKKGSIQEDLRSVMGRQIFGCDICQDVCPWNRRAPVVISTEAPVRQELVNPPLEWLAKMDQREFKQWFQGSPLHRTGRRRLRRNVAVAMGNSRDDRFLPILDEWSQECAGNVSEPEDPVLRETAAWAAEQIRNRG